MVCYFWIAVEVCKLVSWICSLSGHLMESPLINLRLLDNKVCLPNVHLKIGWSPAINCCPPRSWSDADLDSPPVNCWPLWSWSNTGAALPPVNCWPLWSWNDAGVILPPVNCWFLWCWTNPIFIQAATKTFTFQHLSPSHSEFCDTLQSHPVISSPQNSGF